MRTGPSRFDHCSVSKNARAKHIVVQFQNKENVQLHKDSNPGNQEALGIAPPKNR